MRAERRLRLSASPLCLIFRMQEMSSRAGEVVMALADVLVTMRLIATLITIADGIQTLPMELFVRRGLVAMALGV